MATEIDYIIGLPPGNSTDETVQGRTQTVMENSMPIVKIYPGIPSFTKGMSLFTRTPAFRSNAKGKKSLSYSSLLDTHGYRLNQPKYAIGGGNEACIVLAYQADSFPTDSFTNDYGENFLQGITNVASEGAASISQMLGARDLGQAAKNVAGNLKQGGGFQGTLGGMLETAMDKGSSALRTILPKSVTGGVDLVSRLAAGSRIDFPMVWKTSSFQPSYTLTVRLYNPNPSDPESTKKYIAGPLAAIMLLGIPVSSDGITYSWPFIHRITSPGIYDLDPAYISNVTVIKGGDQQQIAYNQQLGVVDVRIDFGSLFSSMLAAHGLTKTRPTLENYLNAMVGPDSVKPGVEKFSTRPLEPTLFEKQQASTSRRRAIESAAIAKNQAPEQVELTETEKRSPPPRVTRNNTAEYNKLLLEAPGPIYTEEEE